MAGTFYFTARSTGLPGYASGRYLGNGGLQPVATGLTGSLVAVTIYSSPSLGLGAGVYYSSTTLQPGDWRNASGAVGPGLTFVGADFVVSMGIGDGPNQPGFVYDWTALVA